MSPTRIIGLAVVAALALPGAALAGDYPPPAKPSTTQKPPKGPFHTLTVCKKGCKYRTIQSAVNKAKAGDTVKVKRGTYREGVTVLGSSKRYLKLVGNPSDRSKVVLDGSRGKGVPRQNGVRVDGANNVTINGFTAKHYNGNGFYLVNVAGYHLNHLNATLVGVYGIYAFNSIGGVMENSEAY
jgi:pectin methylesterase-like acyl-CoA thioesterase